MGVQAVSCGGRPCRWSRWLRKGRRQATAPPSGARRPALAAGAPPRGRRVTAGRRAAAAASRAPGRWAATPPSRGSARCAPFPARPAPDRRRFWTGPAVADRERGGADLSSPRVQRGHRRHVRRVEAPPLREAGAPLPPREAGPTRRTSIAGRGPTPPHPHPRPLPPRRGGRRLHVFFLFCGVGWGRARPISGRPPDASAKGAATFGGGGKTAGPVVWGGKRRLGGARSLAAVASRRGPTRAGGTFGAVAAAAGAAVAPALPYPRSPAGSAARPPAARSSPPCDQAGP